VNWYEQKHRDHRFVRVDSDIVEKLIQKADTAPIALSTAQQELLQPVFESLLPTDPKIHYSIEFEAMDASEPPVVIIQNEYTRRMKEMAAMGGGMSQFYAQMPDNFTIAVNGNHPLVADILSDVENQYGDKLRTTTKKIDAAVAERDAFNETVKGKKDDELTPEEKTMREKVSEKVATLTSERDKRLREIGSTNNLVKQLIDLALLSNGMLKGESLTSFIRRSVELIGK
jgi:molecular chaperone HtpG